MELITLTVIFYNAKNVLKTENKMVTLCKTRINFSVTQCMFTLK